MARYAVIDDQNIVKNVVEWDGEKQWAPPAGCTVRPHEQCAMGDIWMDSIDDFVRPLKVMMAPEDPISMAERAQKFQQAKADLKLGITIINLTGDHEPIE